MKIAVVSESPADEAAIKILVDAVVGSESELFSLRTRPYGWTKIFELLPNIINGLHYGTEVEALVVVMDSDESPSHENTHEPPNEENPECRLCRLRATARTALARLRALPNRTEMKTALGLAVPAIEAWYRAGLDPHVNEVAWNRKLLGEDVSYDKRSLKKDTYGSYQPNLAMETSAAVAAARRLKDNLDLLEELFPNGFGSLIRDLRRWEEA
ncbi:MAG: hypothetical protein QOG23_296 [Blastocatellia bacterium]|jgi:hypothetical protein|nr:hypothetical protein [Blastocatellia bacterium]